MSASAPQPGQASPIVCRECKTQLARVGDKGGVYPLDGVRVTVEGRKVDLQCPDCEQWRTWTIAREAA